MSWRTPYRPLVLVYVVAILAGINEFRRGPADVRREAEIYGDPVRNFPEAMATLYPNRAETEYLLGRRDEAVAERRFHTGELQRDPTLLPRFMNAFTVDLKAAARHYDRAQEMGLKSEENLDYNYALTLMRIRAEPARIDRAIATWRRNFPFSTRRDLEQRRQSIEKQLRQLLPREGAPLTAEEDAQHPRHSVNPQPLPLYEMQKPVTSDGETALSLAFAPAWRPLSGYAGSQACRQCHPEQFETFQRTPHSRALSDVEPEFEPPDAVFDHAASGRRYRVSRREGQMIHEESLPLDDGTEFILTSTPVRYRVGSGHFARTYLCDAGGGLLVESPVTWYASAHAWGMTPGFDKAAHRSFTRQILENCLWCHGGQAQLSTTSSLRLRLVENAIGCERCHGPGEAHVQSQIAGQPADNEAQPAIVNPRRLSRKLAEAVCQQCHLQGDIHIGGRHVRAADFRPGEPLEKFGTVYRLRRTENPMTVVGHVEQLGDSPCYRRSETLTCVTCHDPHRPVAAAGQSQAAHFRSVCLSCHEEPGCKLPVAVREQRSENDCIRCHMPKSATEVPHLAFTHHRIGIHPLTGGSPDAKGSDPLIPLSDMSGLAESERDRSLMLARLQMFLARGRDFRASASGQQLLGRIDEWLRSIPPDEVDVEIEFARFQLLFARGDVRGAEQSAGRALACNDIRSEEEAAILDQLGQLDYGQSRFEQARLRFGKLTRLRCNGQDWFYLGMCEEKCGQSRAAIQALERARHLEPGVVEIYEALAAIQHHLGEFEAERRLKRDIERLGSRLPPGPPSRSKSP
jgi:tetratricopeptide (TPR) repeat protein